jgi:hypothetical protein
MSHFIWMKFAGGTAIVAAIAAVAALWLWLVGYETRSSLAPERIEPESGSAYWLPLAASRLFISQSDSNEHPNVSHLRLFEDGTELGPAHSLHDPLRNRGRGSFSHFGPHRGGGILFSASDNSDPRTNGRAYAAVDRIFLSALVALAIGFLGLAAVAGGAWTMRRTRPDLVARLIRRSGAGWAARNLLPGLLITVVLLIVIVAAVEIHLHVSVPFRTAVWPGRFHPDVGLAFAPHALVRHTNQLDFWNEERTNRYGFLDREPPTEPPASGVCRVAFIGDSFVEAAQVPIKDKFHVLFERGLNEAPRDIKVEAVALGYGGTGQLNQLPFYEKFARPLAPRVVVLVVVGNDLANNSALLEALRHGWHPAHTPQVFAKRDPGTGTIIVQDIDRDWLLFIHPSIHPARRGVVTTLHDVLVGNSMAYKRFYAYLATSYPTIASVISPRPDDGLHISDHAAFLARDPEFRATMARWPPGSSDDMNAEFYRSDPLPPAFEEALTFSDFAFAEWVRRTRRDGVRLLAVTTQSLTTGLAGEPTKYLKRVQELIRKHGIEEIDQTAYSKRKGYAASDAIFRRDPHWNLRGHQRMAKQLIEYFLDHPQLCVP